MARASGAWPSVMSVTISRLSRYRVRGCSPAIEVGTISPFSLYASTSKVAGRAALVRRGFFLATDVGHLDLLRLGRFKRPYFRVAVGTLRPDGRDLVADLVVRGAAAQQRFQVVAGLREQAGVERAFGRQAHAGAARAEGAGDRRDDADLAGAV